jgi:choline dehydrogenase-like flavoprotein
MIVDLAEQPADRFLSTDVLIIGAGISGLLLAARLRDLKIPVIVLESGGRKPDEGEHPLNRVVQINETYRGAAHGRFRCLGGTSTRWGGALIPFLDQDLDDRPHIDLPAWPVGMQELRPHIADIEAQFGIDSGPYDEDFIRTCGAGKHVPAGDADFLPRFAKWPKFHRRNVATLLKARIEGDPDLQVWLNATATGFECDDASDRLRAVTALHPGGGKINVAAKHIVVCAGAIESTRLLLLLDSQSEGRISRECAVLGRFFHDHVSMHVAGIRARRVVDLNRLAGFRFMGPTMRSLRFEFSPSAQSRDCAGSAFGHISFIPAGDSGFDALRNFLRALQRNGRIDPGASLQIFHDVPYLAKAGFWRYFHRQLLWPTPASYELHVVAEQIPQSSSRISLAAERDVFGCPLAAIDWCVGQADYLTINSFVRRFAPFWKRHGLEAIGELEWLVDPSSKDVGSYKGGGDVFHPGGTTRMGVDRRSAVVDRNLRAFSVSNLWIASTSVFPSGASANPTLMLMLFTMRLAAHLGAQLGRSC